MGKDPAMPFYVNDWLSSGSVTCMSLEQQAAYLRLLCHCWKSQDASLPDDDEQLASLSGLGRKWLRGGSALIRKCLIPHPTKPGHLTNEKTHELWQERLAWREKSAEGGRKSAQAKSKGGATKRTPKHQANGNSSSSSSSPSSSSWSTNRRVDRECVLTEEEIGTVRERANRVAIAVGRRATEPEDRSLLLKAAILSLHGPFTEFWLMDAAEGVKHSRGSKQRPYGYLHTCLENSAAALGRNLNAELASVTIPAVLLEPPPNADDMSERMCEPNE